MAPGSCTYRNPRVNPPANLAGEQDKLTGAQGLAKKSNVRSNKAPTKALISLESLTSPFVPLPAKNIFTRFMKVFIEITQV